LERLDQLGNKQTSKNEWAKVLSMVTTLDSESDGTWKEALAQLQGEKVEKYGQFHFHPGGARAEGKCPDYGYFH
jgi:hypothetical protein